MLNKHMIMIVLAMLTVQPTVDAKSVHSHGKRNSTAMHMRVPLKHPLIDLNTADAKSIAKAMQGIGRRRAKAIVDYRNKHGAFHSLDELVKVRGVSKHTLKRYRTKWQEHVSVEVKNKTKRG